jgi:hypothetical protein
MKKMIIFIFTLIFISNLNFAQVDTRLTLEHNIHDWPDPEVGELIINVQAKSANNEEQISLFEDAFQIDDDLISQVQSLTFDRQYFPETGLSRYSRIEDYDSDDGKISYSYVHDGGILNQYTSIPSSEWKTIVSITIIYALTNASSTIEWYDGNPDFLVQDASIPPQQIDGEQLPIPSGLTNIPLPVELSSFSANLKGESVELKWRTETEVDNYGFEVQRLQDYQVTRLQDSEWERIGFVEGNGNSNSPKNYFFSDKNPVGGSKFIYRLKQIDNNGTFAYSNEVEVDIIPGSFELFQNYPNPFNPVTNIKFSLPENSNVKLDIYNITGEHITTLLNKEMEAGFYNIEFNAEALSSGTYIYKLQTDKETQAKKMLLLK